jgi:signal transduction histidine kinase/HAMP domain-containing protein
VVGVNGNVFYSLDPDHLGKDVAEIPSVDAALFDIDNLQDVIIHDPERVIAVSPIYAADQRTPRFFAYTAVSNREVAAEKTALTRLFVFGSLATILITSLAIFISFNRMILYPISGLVEILKRVGTGDLTSRVREPKSLDEIGSLQRSTNTMIEARQQTEAKIIHLNRVLRAIRNVNQLITQERDLDRLLERACDHLTSTDGYGSAWILLLDEDGTPTKFVRRDMEGNMLFLPDLLEQDELMACAQTILAQAGAQIITDGSDVCKDCFLLARRSGSYDAMAIRLEYDGRLYGLLNISVHTEYTIDVEEISLFEEVAGDISFALFSLELEEKRVKAENELRELNANLDQQVRERTALLDASNKELEAFAYSISHDLRAPLRHIDGFLQILKQREADRLDSTSEHYLNNVTDATARMGNLIEDLLRFSRTSRLEMELRSVDPGIAIQEVRKDLAPMLEGRKIVFEVQPLKEVLADPALLRIVWTNLISNAIKFTALREEAHIEIGCQPPKNPGEVIFFIRDNGVGFDPQYANNLFGVFQRLHQREEFEGTGIGLATVQRIVHRHGGEIWAEAIEGQGATFYFFLQAAA